MCMLQSKKMPKLTIPKIKQRQFTEKLVCITAYSARMAELIDDYADIILVGDSLGMTLHGFDSTHQVTLDMMIMAAQAVNRKRKKALLVVDMPYSTYEYCEKKAYENATKILQQTKADAVKLEGGAMLAPIIRFLTDRNIPVMGHVGLLPQSSVALGGYSARGKTRQEAKKLLEDIDIISRSGCFSIVLEGVIQSVAQKMVELSRVPVIGIGASENCDGQVLVSDDILGMTEKTAKFVKKYANATELFKQAFFEFSKEVKENKFPSADTLYY